MGDADTELLDQINKRLTLNLLIEGSAQHAFLTSHHLVREELSHIDGDLLLMYDRFALAAFVSFWHGMSVLFFGRPRKFWKRTSRRRHPFHRHALLAKHGGTLAEAARERVTARCREKGVTLLPYFFSRQILELLRGISEREQQHRLKLVELAKKSTHAVWGIPYQQLDAELTTKVAFGTLSMPDTFAGRLMRTTAVGYGGVMRIDDELLAVAKARVWPLLSHELVKATVELICLHGLNSLDDKTYSHVVSAADRVEYENWLLQAGCELWRRMLPLMPDGVAVSQVVMRLAQLQPKPLEIIMLAVVEKPEWARELLAGLAEAPSATL